VRWIKSVLGSALPKSGTASRRVNEVSTLKDYVNVSEQGRKIWNLCSENLRERFHILINYFIPQSKLPEAPDGGGDVQLVAVSKFQSNDAIMAAYEAGQRVFGENYVQELVGKAPALPADIRWHFIGTLQSNKAKGLIAGACSTPHSL